MAYNSLTVLNEATKNQAPKRKSPFCGLKTDILLADTYIIAVLVKFVKV